MFDKSAYTQYEWLKLEIELKNKVNALLAEKEVLQNNIKLFSRLATTSLLGLMGSLAFTVLLGPAVWISVVFILVTAAGTGSNAFFAMEHGAALGTRKYRDSVQERLDNAQSNLEMFYIANDWPITFKGSPEAADAARVEGLKAEINHLKERNRNQERQIANLKRQPKEIETVEVTDAFGNPVDVYKDRLARTQMKNGGFI